MTGSGDAVPSKKYIDLDANVGVLDEILNSTEHSVENRDTPNGNETSRTISGFNADGDSAIEQFNQDAAEAIAAAGYSIIGDFGDATKKEIEFRNQVYTSLSVPGFEEYVWKYNGDTLPYTPTGDDPNSAPEAGKWSAIAIGTLKSIALSLNVAYDSVIYSADTTTELDDIVAIRAEDQQTTYIRPTLNGDGETIQSVVDDILTTEPNSDEYQMRVVTSPADLGFTGQVVKKTTANNEPKDLYFILSEYESAGFCGVIMTSRGRAGNLQNFKMTIEAVKSQSVDDDGVYNLEYVGSGPDMEIVIVKYQGEDHLAVVARQIPANSEPRFATFIRAIAGEMVPVMIFADHADIGAERPVTRTQSSYCSTWGFNRETRGKVLTTETEPTADNQLVCKSFVEDTAAEAGGRLDDSEVRIGVDAGGIDQGDSAVAVGAYAGEENQREAAVAVGKWSGTYLQGNYAVAIGHNAGEYSQPSTSIAIGDGAEPTAISQIVIGNADSTVNIGDGNVQSVSDLRDKYAIEDLPFGLDFINSLTPKLYKYDVRELYEETVRSKDRKSVQTIKHPRDGTKAGKRFHAGLIAQDVKVAMDKAGIDFGLFVDQEISATDSHKERASGKLALRYTELIAPLISAVQELSSQNSELLARMEKLEKPEEK